MRKFLFITLSIIGFTFTALPDVAFADDQLKLGDVYDIPVMYLNKGLNTTQTANFTAAAPVRNNETIIIQAMSGALFELFRNGQTELVYATRVAVNQSTGVVTLTGTVLRDICYNIARTLSSCNGGLKWDKGAELRLVNSAKRYNRYVDSTRSNVLNASGALTFNGSGSLAFPTFATIAERNRQLGANPGGSVRTACVTATGACYYYLGGAWIGFGSGGTINATSSTRGVVELAATTDIANGTTTGDSGAPLVVPTGIVARTSTGSTQANKLAALGTNGLLSGSLLGTGTRDSSTFLSGNQTWGNPPASFYFGSGGSGAVFVDSGSTLTLNADGHYTNLTVYSGATVKPNGFRIFVTGTLKLSTITSGTGRQPSINVNGGSGSVGQTAGVNETATNGGAGGLSAHGTGTLVGTPKGANGAGGGAGAVNGANGATGYAGTGSFMAILGNGAKGSAGGNGGNTGGTGGAQTFSNTGTYLNRYSVFNTQIAMPSWQTGRVNIACSAASGGGGGGGGDRDGGSAGDGGGGGGGGAQGGNLDLYVNVLTGSGYIQANGGNGGAGGNGGNGNSNGDGGGGGGGGGGCGGILNMYFKTLSNFNGKIEARGGAGGAGGTQGGAGTAGTAGGTGTNGLVSRYQVR